MAEKATTRRAQGKEEEAEEGTRRLPPGPSRRPHRRRRSERARVGALPHPRFGPAIAPDAPAHHRPEATATKSARPTAKAAGFRPCWIAGCRWRGQLLRKLLGHPDDLQPVPPTNRAGRPRFTAFAGAVQAPGPVIPTTPPARTRVNWRDEQKAKFGRRLTAAGKPECDPSGATPPACPTKAPSGGRPRGPPACGPRPPALSATKPVPAA